MMSEWTQAEYGEQAQAVLQYLRKEAEVPLKRMCPAAKSGDHLLSGV
jgi:hypothetical protein